MVEATFPMKTCWMHSLIEAQLGCRRSDWSLCLLEKLGKVKSSARYSVEGIQKPTI